MGRDCFAAAAFLAVSSKRYGVVVAARRTRIANAMVVHATMAARVAPGRRQAMRSARQGAEERRLPVGAHDNANDFVIFTDLVCSVTVPPPP